MTRLGELQKRYPTIPRDVIIKHDVTVQGVRHGGDLEKISVWTPAKWLYQSKDYDITLTDLAKKTTEVKPGYVLRHPEAALFDSGLGTDIRLRSSSPYMIREVSEGKFALFDEEEKIKDIYFLTPKPRRTPEPVTSKGTPISTLIDFKPRCSWIVPMRFCEYFSRGKQCRFCNFNATHEEARAIGLDDPITISLEETVEAFQIRSSEVRQIEATMVMGGLLDVEPEAKIFLDFVGKISTAASTKPTVTVRTQAMDRKNMQRLRDAGLNCLAIQMEVMDPQLFAEMCPGKVRHMPYEGWIQAFQDAVDVFGAGNVAGKLIPGITLMSPNGHKTWQEARDYHVEANHWLIKLGVLPIFYAMWWAPGSLLSQDESIVDKFPPTEYLLDLALAHDEDMTKYGLYERVNKFIYCGLDCTQGGYVADIGMVRLFGDVGNWMADVVSDEENWLAHFLASVRSGEIAR